MKNLTIGELNEFRTKHHISLGFHIVMSDPTMEPPTMMYSHTDLPIMGFTLVVMLCLYVAFRAYKEFTAESKLKSAMYEETGIDGSYTYQLPVEEKVRS